MIFSFLLTVSLLLGNPSFPPAGTTYAVVVGIADYERLSSRTGDLRFADRDARQVATFLQSKAGGRIPASQLRLLTNQQATQSAIQQALTLFQRATPADRVIFYFSGHGLPDSFVPYDGKPGATQTYLAHRAIKQAFLTSGATTKLCIADACLSGSMTRPVAVRPSRAVISDLPQSGNVAMLLASRSTESAIEASQLAGGAFTHYLLAGLTGRADQNGDRVVTIRELHRYVSPRVRAVTRGRQAPVFYGHFSDQLALAYP